MRKVYVFIFGAKVRHFYRFCKFFSHFFWQYQLLAVTLFSNYEF